VIPSKLPSWQRVCDISPLAPQTRDQVLHPPSPPPTAPISPSLPLPARIMLPHRCSGFLSSVRIGSQKHLGPKGGRPRRNRQGKSASHARPKERDKGITAQTRGSKRPKARLVFLLDMRGRPRPPLKSPHGGPLAGPTAGRRRPAPRPLVGQRGAFAGWPLFGPNHRKYVEENDPREPVTRPPIGAGQCRPPAIRRSSPSKQRKVQLKKHQVPTNTTTSCQDIQAHVGQSHGDITSTIRPRGEANEGPTKAVQPLARPIRRPRTPPPRAFPPPEGPNRRNRPTQAHVRGRLPRGGARALRPGPQATLALLELGAAARRRRPSHQTSVKFDNGRVLGHFAACTVALAACFRATSASSSETAASTAGAVAFRANPQVLTDPKTICGCRMSRCASVPRRVANSSRSTVRAPFGAPFPNTSRPTLISEG